MARTFRQRCLQHGYRPQGGGIGTRPLTRPSPGGRGDERKATVVGLAYDAVIEGWRFDGDGYCRTRPHPSPSNPSSTNAITSPAVPARALRSLRLGGRGFPQSRLHTFGIVGGSPGHNDPSRTQSGARWPNNACSTKHRRLPDVATRGKTPLSTDVWLHIQRTPA